MFITGGGHGNFIWLFLFLFVDLLGIYFPLMAVLAIDLRSRFVRIVFGSLILFNLAMSSIMIFGWINEVGDERPSEFTRQLQVNGIEFIVFCAALHFLPTVVFSTFLVIAFWRRSEYTDNDNSVQALGLE